MFKVCDKVICRKFILLKYLVYDKGEKLQGFDKTVVIYSDSIFYTFGTSSDFIFQFTSINFIIISNYCNDIRNAILNEFQAYIFIRQSRQI